MGGMSKARAEIKRQAKFARKLNRDYGPMGLGRGDPLSPKDRKKAGKKGGRAAEGG